MRDVGGDRSAASLILINLLTIALAFYEGWSLGSVIVVYWVQSVVIGVFTVFRIWDISLESLPDEIARKLRGSELEGNTQLSPEKRRKAGRFIGKYGADGGLKFLKLFFVGFFILHYGLFHYGYYEFINPVRVVRSMDSGEMRFFFLVCLLFTFNHAYSYLYNRKDDGKMKVHPADVVFKPYNRIMPMHFTIIFGGFTALILSLAGIPMEKTLLIFFLLAKTFADVWGHKIKHKAGKNEKG